VFSKFPRFFRTLFPIQAVRIVHYSGALIALPLLRQAFGVALGVACSKMLFYPARAGCYEAVEILGAAPMLLLIFSVSPMV
jgi:hypothetical protein